MTTLNIVNKSPFEKRSLEQCLSRIGKGDSVLLIEDAVVAAVAGTVYTGPLEKSAEASQLYVLQPDLLARGLGDSDLVSAFNKVDYAEFVALVTEHERVHSWL